MSADDTYDVVVIGGALSGSALALLLKRWRPGTRILIVERQQKFRYKVGEATVEVFGHFLASVLRLQHVLSREHLPKHGLRFWFTDGEGRSLAEMSEVSSETVPELQSFQLDRSRLDESLLALGREEGCEVARPATVTNVDLSWPRNRLTLELDGSTRTVEARWVVDASGRQAFLGRRMGLLSKFEEHSTAALWGRWHGVADMDGVAVLGADPRRPSLPEIPAARRLCTNHFCGYGWWCWVIPLSGGETSVGLVYDKRLMNLEGGSHRQRFEDFVRSRDGLRELLAEARLDEDDFQSYDHLAYRTSRYMDRGWALVGDAAAFLDPLYSPGLDHCAFSAYATASLIEQDLDGVLEGGPLESAIADHNRQFERSYECAYHALYEDKYELLGDAQLTGAAFYMDTAMYYLGVVRGVVEHPDGYRHPVLGQDTRASRLAYRILRFANRRLVKLARRRRRRGTYGRRNTGWRCMNSDFGRARRRLTGAHRKGLRLWLGAELGEMWQRTLGRLLRRPRLGAGVSVGEEHA